MSKLFYLLKSIFLINNKTNKLYLISLRFDILNPFILLESFSIIGNFTILGFLALLDSFTLLSFLFFIMPKYIEKNYQ